MTRHAIGAVAVATLDMLDCIVVMRITWPNMVNGFLGHMVAVGLPCWWVVRSSGAPQPAAA